MVQHIAAQIVRAVNAVDRALTESRLRLLALAIVLFLLRVFRQCPCMDPIRNPIRVYQTRHQPPPGRPLLSQGDRDDSWLLCGARDP